MTKFVLVTQEEFNRIVKALPSWERQRLTFGETAISQWGFQAVRFMSHYEEWVVIPYTAIGTAEEALKAAQAVDHDTVQP